ncbi:hypothetical protein [Paracoccus beibuensis]|uniref:hypothetical protein n=1 Tax=Paracoccus beibuensis TaxID=547602 RepID=UPI00223F2585|nr:hypothetical protein [Paracoccus beibuensis]
MFRSDCVCGHVGPVKSRNVVRINDQLGLSGARVDLRAARNVASFGHGKEGALTADADGAAESRYGEQAFLLGLAPAVSPVVQDSLRNNQRAVSICIGATADGQPACANGGDDVPDGNASPDLRQLDALPPTVVRCDWHGQLIGFFDKRVAIASRSPAA